MILLTLSLFSRQFTYGNRITIMSELRNMGSVLKVFDKNLVQLVRATEDDHGVRLGQGGLETRIRHPLPYTEWAVESGQNA